ncbi:MAG: CDP-diacylglycerol--glycerol-3-phosphate 3-phosphatidyltransferase, partial [Eubacterium sp.]|nr:CDP-diacylglycerol--glycerol-3-phosphate 3-phosphatidyltransferase [Candidatus Colimonas fimequi]
MENKTIKNKNLPNQLTMARIFAVPVFIVLLMLDFRLLAAVIFILAALTDMLDGKIARKYNLVTNFGKLMDPLADKLLTMAAFVCFVGLGDIPAWTVVLILGREFFITGIRQVAAAEGIVIAAAWSGKIKTVCQMIAIPLLLLAPLNLIPYLDVAAKVAFWAAVFMTVW